MSQTIATEQFESAASLHNAGAVASVMDPSVPGKFLNYVATYGQDIAHGAVTLELADDSRRMLMSAQQNRKADKKLDAMQKAAPGAKPGQLSPAAALQQRGMQQRNAMTARVFGRQPGHYAALNNVAAPKPAMKPQPVVAPKPVAKLAPTMVMQVGQMQNTKNDRNRAALRLVDASPDAPKPARPSAPTSFARRHQKLCQGMGAFNFG
jgi:hypothetical protein